MFKAELKIWQYPQGDFQGGWDDYSDNIVFPIKMAEMLDERLDEFEIQLARTTISAFRPYTPCQLILKTSSKVGNTIDYVCDESNRETGEAIHGYNSDVGKYTGYQKRVIYCLIASDNAPQEPNDVYARNGKLFYKHNLHLIEITKITERFVCDSLTFTNPLGYSADNWSKVALYYLTGSNTNQFASGNKWLQNDVPVVPSIFLKNESVTIPFWSIIDCNFSGSDYYFADSIWLGSATPNLALRLRVLDPSGSVVSGSEKFLIQYNNNYYYTAINNDNTVDTSSPATDADKVDFTFSPSVYGRYTIEYTIYVLVVSVVTEAFKLTFAPYSLLTYKPMKKWTCKDVCNRIFDLAEPLSYNGIAPRFYLNSDYATLLDGTIAPELSMTKMTLREQLQMVGKFIQAEPRVSAMIWDLTNKRWRFEISFDYYGMLTTSKISNYPEATRIENTNDSDFATSLDTSVENLVSQLDWATGVITEPFQDGEITLRAESMAVRLEDNENSVIHTDLPIYAIPNNGLVCVGYGTRSGGSESWTLFENTSYGKEVDLTPFVYESTDYANLSSYDAGANGAKAMALYYTMGSKNIKGLFFKKQSLYQAYSDYSIINILEAVTGLSLSITDYPLLLFRVTYLPVESARLRTSKALSESGLPSTIPYNQGANLIESKWFGENLKGVIARIGNVEKILTYKLPWLGRIPKVGYKYDDDFYISSVSSEIRPDNILCTITLSKDYNRLSEYVGISTNKRMWEVSERQVQRREIVYHTRAVLDYSPLGGNKTDIFKNKDVFPLFLKKASSDKVGVSAKVATYAKTSNGTATIAPSIARSVASLPLGNSLCFTFSFEDNYSAGQRVQFVTDSSYADIQGYWANYTPYCDYYGRVYYIKVELVGGITLSGNTYSLAFPNIGLPHTDNVASTAPLIFRKDSREIPQITMEVSATSKNENIVIGSAFAGNCGYVTKTKNLKFAWFSAKIPKLGNSVPTIISSESYTYNGTDTTLDLSSFFASKPNGAVAWGIITESSSQTIDVQNENGDETTQDIVTPSELVLGSNRLVDDEGNNLSKIYANFIDNTIDTI